MSLVLITNPPSTLVVSSNWTDFVAREDISNIGTGLSIPIFTLTNWDGSTTKPQIASGSIIEVGGSIYQADANTALTDGGGLTDGTVHIKLVPAGGGATVVPTLTNDSIPAWGALKGGWYDSDDKFLPFEMTKASAVYTVKSEFIDQNKTIRISSFGSIYINDTLNADSISVSSVFTDEITVTTNNVTTQNMTGTMKWKYYTEGTGRTQGQSYTLVSSWIPVVGDFMAVQGVFDQGGSQGFMMGIDRISSSQIVATYYNVIGNAIATDSFVSGGGTGSFTFKFMSNFDAAT